MTQLMKKCKFDQTRPTRNDSLLAVRESNVVRPRSRPSDALNTRRQIEFDASTSREPSQFEHTINTLAIDDEVVSSEIAQVIQRANPAPARGRRTRQRWG